jgi:hypothetical protein
VVGGVLALFFLDARRGRRPHILNGSLIYICILLVTGTLLHRVVG